MRRQDPSRRQLISSVVAKVGRINGYIPLICPTNLSLKPQICGCNSVVECQLPKLNVAGSSPVTRLLNEQIESRLQSVARLDQLEYLRANTACTPLAIQGAQDQASSCFNLPSRGCRFSSVSMG